MILVDRPMSITPNDPLDAFVARADHADLTAAGLTVEDIDLVRHLPAWDWPAGLYLCLAVFYRLMPASGPLEV